MLAMWGLLVVIIFMVLIMTKKATPFTALVLSPIIIGLMAGFANELGGFALDGVKGVAPTANALIGSPSASALTVSPSVIGPSHKVLVLYDEPQGKEFQKLGKAYAIMLRNRRIGL